MTTSFSVFALRTPVVAPGDDITQCILGAVPSLAGGGLQDGDVLVIAESALASAEGRITRLDRVVPSGRARELAGRFGLDPRVAELVLRESDEVQGGIPGFILSLKNGTLLPNAGIDASNAPPGCVVLLPEDPDRSAALVRRRLRERTGRDVAVIIADSRTHAMRMGSGGVAIGCAGIPSILDDRGRTDLFGRELHVTRRALADNIASAAEIVMGEADESVPAAVIRGLGIPFSDRYSGVEKIAAGECLFMGLLQHTGDPGQE